MGLHGEAFWRGISPAEFYAILSDRARRNRERDQDRTDGPVSPKQQEAMLDEFEAMQDEMIARASGVPGSSEGD